MTVVSKSLPTSSKTELAILEHSANNSDNEGRGTDAGLAGATKANAEVAKVVKKIKAEESQTIMIKS